MNISLSSCRCGCSSKLLCSDWAVWGGWWVGGVGWVGVGWGGQNKPVPLVAPGRGALRRARAGLAAIVFRPCELMPDSANVLPRPAAMRQQAGARAGVMCRECKRQQFMAPREGRTAARLVRAGVPSSARQLSLEKSREAAAACRGCQHGGPLQAAARPQRQERMQDGRDARLGDATKHRPQGTAMPSRRRHLRAPPLQG